MQEKPREPRLFHPRRLPEPDEEGLRGGRQPKDLYRQRPQVETSNYMVKTHNGSQILLRLPKTNVVEGLCKSIAHNCKIVAEKEMEWSPSV